MKTNTSCVWRSYMLFQKRYTILSSLLLFFLINSQGTSQCSITADFTYSSLDATLMPWDVDFENASIGTISTYSWTVDGIDVSNMEDFTHTFQQSTSYNVCLKVREGACEDEECKNIFIDYDCSIVCVHPINGNFESIETPIIPDSVGSSNQFDNHVCNWNQQNVSPYYCYYPEDSYVATRISLPETESILSESDLDLVTGDDYTICFDYSIQRILLTNNPLPTAGVSEVEIKLFGTGGTQTIVSVSDPQVDYPSAAGSSFYLQNDWDCVNTSEVEWHRYCTNFTFDDSRGQMILTGQRHTNNGVWAVIYWNNIEIVGCADVCDESPYFTVDVDCESDFVISDTLSGSTYTWDFGDGQTATGNSPSHTYLFGGVFNACVTMDCGEFEDLTFCRQVIIPDSCSNCGSQDSIIVDARQCEHGDSIPDSYIADVSFEIPNGYGPCGSSFYTGSLNANIDISSFYIDESPSGHDVVNLSFDINPYPGEDITSGFTGHISVCGPNGEIICYDIIITGSECACEVQEIIISATCDTIIGDSTYIYSGTIDLTGLGNVLDYFTSISSLSLNASTGAFTITTSYGGPISGKLILVTRVGNIELCHEFTIMTEDPCVPPPDDCLDDWYGKSLTCITIDNQQCYTSGNMTIPIPPGYHLCEGSTYIEVDSGEVTINPGTGVGSGSSNLNYNITWCPPAGYAGSTVHIRFIFCNDDGDMVCYGVYFNLPSCNRSRKAQVYDSPTYQIYPNPIVNHLKVITLYDSFEDFESIIKIYNAVGDEVFRSTIHERNSDFDLSRLSSGIYIVKILNDNVCIQTDKIIVAK